MSEGEGGKGGKGGGRLLVKKRVRDCLLMFFLIKGVTPDGIRRRGSE